jgi:sugar phosphate isomerase/epimerase
MSPPVSVNTLCLAPAALANHVDLIARLGVEGIAITIDEVEENGAQGVRALLGDAGLIASTMTHRAFAFAAPDEAEAARQRLLRSIDRAAAIGSPSVTMTTGGRGPLSWSEALLRFAEEIAPCAEAARAAGVALAVEPTSHLYADASIAHRLADLVTIARTAGVNLGIDMFACWFDSDIEQAIADAVPLCRLVQVSDQVGGDRGLPCRAVPGDGMGQTGRLLRTMVAAGYRGWFDVEVISPRLAAEGFEIGLTRAVAAVREAISEP